MEDEAYIYDDSDEAWRARYESMIYDWCSSANSKPSYNPIIRYYCGYVEPLCRRLNESSNKPLAGFLTIPDTDFTAEDIDYTELHSANWFDRWLIPPIPTELYQKIINPPKPLMLHQLRDYDKNLWSYAVVRNLIEYDALSDFDKDYIDKCLNKYSYREIFRYYLNYGDFRVFDHVRTLYDASIQKHYMIVQYPLSGLFP